MNKDEYYPLLLFCFSFPSALADNDVSNRLQAPSTHFAIQVICCFSRPSVLCLFRSLTLSVHLFLLSFDTSCSFDVTVHDSVLHTADSLYFFQNGLRLCALKLTLFNSPSSCIYHLLLPLRNTSVIPRPRSTSSYPCPTSRTNKYQSFITYALHKYQPPLY